MIGGFGIEQAITTNQNATSKSIRCPCCDSGERNLTEVVRSGSLEGDFTRIFYTVYKCDGVQK